MLACVVLAIISIETTNFVNALDDMLKNQSSSLDIGVHILSNT